MAVANLLRDASPIPSTAPSTAPAPASTSDLTALNYQLPADIAVPPFAQSSKDPERDLARLYEAVSGARRIAVICGAGISVSSPANIPDFRSAHGLFKKLKEKHPTAGLSSGKDLFDARLFSSESTSALFYSMVAELKRLADEAQPTIFHRFLKRLDDEGRLQRVYTQNIDGLEEKAGLTFGLGEAGDSTSTVRALGKRKRLGASDWSRSKSDSALLFAHKQELQQSLPMFPRTIPLHGTLQTLTCALCNHKVLLGNTVHQHSDQRDDSLPASRQGSASLGHEESKRAIELLQNGEAVPCPRCVTADEVRTSNNMRSRGVGRMKVDIVLYGGQNEGAERVGQCLQRDILGLRDPNEPPVPESAAETRARERKEKKQAAKLELERHQSQSALKHESAVAGDASIDSESAIDSELGALLPCQDSKDDILARAFAEDADAEASEPKSGTQESTAPSKKKAARPPRLKPLPPDLLIVAGTSLKVPGTKRIVREFAKACHAQDEWLVYSSDDEPDSSTAEESKKRRAKQSNDKPDKSAGTSTEDAEDTEHEQDDEIHDPSAPIRTILLNYDFPNPAREWEDVFDVWIQGDLQRAALSLFPSKPVDEAAPVEAQTIEQVVRSHTWAKFSDYLDEQRKLAKKQKRAALTDARKGRFHRTVSAAAKMERTQSSATPPASAASGFKSVKARSRSESPVKKRAASTAPAKRGGGLKRSTSKANPFAAAGVTVDIDTIQEEDEQAQQAQGKGRDGGTVRKESPPSVPPPSAAIGRKRSWARSQTMPEQQLVVLVDSQASNCSGATYGKQKRNQALSKADKARWADMQRGTAEV
jgi:NAD-dependent SIR2 family protein deacetylase